MLNRHPNLLDTAIIFTRAWSIFADPDAYDVTDISWDAGISWDSSQTADPAVVYELDGDDEGAGWSEWDEIEDTHTVMITLDAGSGNIIQAGFVSMGTVNEFNNPKYGITENLVDYSIVKELNNGAFYIRKRDVVRRFSGGIALKRDPSFYKFLLSILKANGQVPLATMIVDDDNWEWIVYGRFVKAGGPHIFKNDSVLNFELLEVL